MKNKKRILCLLFGLLVVGFAFVGHSPSIESAGRSPQAAEETVSETENEQRATSNEQRATETEFVAREVTLCGKSFMTSKRKLDLSGISSAEVDEACEILSEMPNLVYVDIGGEENGLSLQELEKLFQAAPNASFSYDFQLYGQSLNTFDRVLDFNHYTIEDNGEGLLKMLPFMRNCRTLDLDSCGLSNELCDSIRQAYPELKVIWRIWFGSNYSVRTDVEKILASKPSVGGDIGNEDAQAIKYCTELKFLDLGHNEELSDFSFISELKNLRVAVVSITALEDLTPFASCSELYYLEAGNTKISDLSPLASCSKLEHLNVGTCFEVKDISPLYELELKRLWLGSGDPVPAEQVAKMAELHPGIEIDTTCPTGYEGGTVGANEGFVMGKWKSYKQYLAADWEIYNYTGSFPAQKPKGVFRVVYDAFEYALNPACYQFSWYDELLEPHDSIYGDTSGGTVDLEEREEGRVVYLTKDEDSLEAWQTLAAAYEAETGVKVTVKAGETIEDSLLDVDCATIFELSDSEEYIKFKDSCLELSQSGAYSRLTSPYLALSEGGEVLGLPKSVGTYGIVVNKKLLEGYGFSVEDIKDYDSLLSAVSAITEQRNVSSTVAAFVSGAMGDISSTGLTTRLVNVPLAMEFRDSEVPFKTELEGTYLDKFHSFWDLCIYNMNCSYYDLSPAAVYLRQNYDSFREFAAGEGVFFICGDEIWDTMVEDGRISEEDIAIIPIYMGIGDESSQGLCTGSESFWCVNKNAPEEDIAAALDFLEWCVSSEAGTGALADMGLNLPYENARETDNLFIKTDRQLTEQGKIPVSWCFGAMPTESWRDEVNYEMGAYAANLGDWGDIYGEIVTVWKAEYAIK